MSLNDNFSDKKINTGRQIELDLAKSLPIIFMVFVHVLWVIQAFDNSLSPGYVLLVSNIFGRPCAAPVFMFCMGAGMIYSRHSRWDQMIKRGVTLFLSGILVNVFEFFVPYYLYEYLFNDWSLFTIADGLLLFCVDILAFAGLTFILIGIYKKHEISSKHVLLLTIGMPIIGSLFRYTDFRVTILNLFFGYFIGTKGGFAAFPLFNWFILPVAGDVWGYFFIRAKDKGHFLRHWPICLIISFIYFFASTQIENGFLTDIHQYYFMTTIDVFFCTLYAHGSIGLCHYLSKFLPERIIKVSAILSGNISNIYIIQWLFVNVTIILLAYIFKGIVFTDLMATIISIFVLVISTLYALHYRKMKNRKAKS